MTNPHQPELPAPYTTHDVTELAGTRVVETLDLFTAEQMLAMYQQGTTHAASRPADGVPDRGLVEMCRDALAEELSAWDIDPPLAHVKEAHDACVAWLASAPTSAQAADPFCPKHGHMYAAGCADCSADIDMLSKEDHTPDAAALSKSTAKRVTAPAASGGEDGWSLAMRVREALDRASCPDHFMRIAVETITGDAPQPTSTASVSERARVSLDLNNLPAEWPWDEGSPCLDPRPVGMVYPAVPTPRAFGYLDSTGVEWAAYDTGQMEEYGRRAFADGANTALRALEQALTQQPTASAEHWHGLYRKECRLRQDDAARYGQQIVDLEAALTQQRGECVAEVFEDSTGCRFPRWAPTVRQLPVPGTKLYTTHQPSADAVRELVKRWRKSATESVLRDRQRIYLACSDELESLLGRGG